MKPSDWLGYSAADREADVKKQAAVKLSVPESAVEVLWAGSCWPARESQEKTNVSRRNG